ncbi:MAG: SpoIIE family protein phosphatase [Cyanothece sp. SIO1E1]|nr:SpoIIE family protein phosphatase [Cyanothece sp. SIO1E1]
MFQILVIDDDPIIRVFLSRALQAESYSVALANDGISGLKQAEELCPDLIICDWIMPGIDGLEVCRRIKANANLSTTFFILLTSRGGLEDRVRGLDTGADDFLSKPVELNELKARVRAALRTFQLNRDLQAQKQRLELELMEAAEYVRSLLPSPLLGNITIDSRFIPSKQLGGDCFDYYWLDPDYLVIYLLDVSGHGLGAALPSVSMLSLLRSRSLPNVSFYRPDDVLRALNQVFQMEHQNDKYFTMWYGVYNRLTRELVYASAGHPPAILLSTAPDGLLQAERLKTRGMPVGVTEDAQFKCGHCQIPSGSLLYIFSDGVYEVTQPNGNVWGIDAFINLLISSGECSSLDSVLNNIQTLNAQTPFEDDLSLLKVKFD